MSRIQVAVGIIHNREDNTVLLGRRPDGKVQGGKWEFPGGKLEQDESVLDALKREVYEETGICIQSAHPLVQLEHDHENLQLTLHAWCVDKWTGLATGREGQTVEWVNRAELPHRTMPSVNDAILAAYDLSPLYLVTPDLKQYDEQFLRQTELLLENGVKLVQFRSRRSTFAGHHTFLRELVGLCNQHACRLIYNGSIDDALSIGAHGIHLRSSVLEQTVTRPDFPGLLSTACHSLEQVRHANRIKSDLCVLAPVQQTASHPETPVLGWPNFSKMAAHARQPVYALGGIRPDQLAEARSYGAHGIAMISGIWSAKDPVAALQTAIQNNS